MTDDEILLYASDFVAFSESKWGFYPGRHYNSVLGRWYADDPRNPKPIAWQSFERRWMKEAFAVLGDGRPKYHTVFRIDIAKSGKTLFLAALGDWMGKMVDYPGGEVLYAANAEEQAQRRAFLELVENLHRHPVPYHHLSADSKYVRYRSGNVAFPIPIKANTQAGPDAIAILFDELWGYNSVGASKLFAEAKRSPTRNYSIKVAATYTGYADDVGPLNDTIAKFFGTDGAPMRDVEPVPGLEDLPCWRRGETFLWWNHEPLWPWHTDGEMRRIREEFESQPTEYARIWQAEIVARTDSLIDPMRLAACEDKTWRRLIPEDQGYPMVIGLDIGTKRDSLAVVARGYDPVLDRYPLYDYKIWVPGMDSSANDPGQIIRQAGQWILDIGMRHHIMAVYYDDTQAALLASILRKAGLNMVEVKQAHGREKADMLYFDLLVGRSLRNFPDAYDLFDHILGAVARRTTSGFRIQKSRSTALIDGCMADVFACWGAHELKDRFRSTQKRGRIVRETVRNVYNDIFGIKS